MSAPFDRILAVDFETAYCSKDYTLRKLTTESYIRDPRFKAWGLSWEELRLDDALRTENTGGPQWVSGADIQEWVDSIDWSRTAILAQNAMFDGAILSWHYNAKPAFIFDTLSMARAKRGLSVKNSLEQLANDFNLPPKGNELRLTDGVLDALHPQVEAQIATYCKHDTWLCVEIFKRLLPDYPVSELRLVDLTLKMFVFPQLVLDSDMLANAIVKEREQREGLLARLKVTDGMLASNDHFAQVLRDMGVEPPTKKKKPTKKTPNPEGVAFAFAKNDALFQAMLNGDNEDVALLCEARMKVKSTSERTRAQRFLDIATRGTLPVPLSYYGARSGRWTAAKGSAINMQNLKRGSFLRKAIMAPDGHVLVVGDLSQIEPRVLAWLADYDEMLDIFRAGGDPYAAFGAQMFNLPGMTKDSHPVERQSAKSALLGAGYQLGWGSFAAQLLTGFLGAPPLRYTMNDAKKLGVTAKQVRDFLDNDRYMDRMVEIPHTCTDEELLIHCLASKAIIDKYRSTAAPVQAFWSLLQELIEYSLYGGKEYTHKCLVFRKEEIVLPNGMSLLYPDLKRSKNEEGRVQWDFAGDKGREKLYAGRVANNVTQGTARIVMTDGMLRTSKKYFVAGTVHDEQICIAPESEANDALPWVIDQMTKEPTYMPGIPLSADGGVHKRYGLAKN